MGPLLRVRAETPGQGKLVAPVHGGRVWDIIVTGSTAGKGIGANSPGLPDRPTPCFWGKTMGQEGRGRSRTPKGRRPRRRGCGSPTGSRAVVALSQPSQGQDPGHGGAWGQEMRDFCCQGLGGTAFPKGQETDGLTRMVSQAFWGQGRARTREEALACAEMKLVGLQVGSPPHPRHRRGWGHL